MLQRILSTVDPVPCNSEALDWKEGLEGSLEQWLKNVFGSEIASPWDHICGLILKEGRDNFEDWMEEAFVQRMKNIMHSEFDSLGDSLDVRKSFEGVCAQADPRVAAEFLVYLQNLELFRLPADYVMWMGEALEGNMTRNWQRGSSSSVIRNQTRGQTLPLVYSSDLQSHVHHLKEVLQLLQQEDWKIKFSKWLEEAAHGYQHDPDTFQLLAELSIDSKAKQYFTIKYGLSRFRGKIWIGHNPSLQHKLIDNLHASPVEGYSGFQVTYQGLKGWFAWNGMKRVIQNRLKQPLYRAPQQMQCLTDKRRSFKYFGPFQFVDKVEPVAYKLQFLEHSTVHPVSMSHGSKRLIVFKGCHMTNCLFILMDEFSRGFSITGHHQQLKSVHGVPTIRTHQVPRYQDGCVPGRILDHRSSQAGTSALNQVLVQWGHGDVADATWKSLTELHKEFLQTLAWGQASFQGEANVRKPMLNLSLLSDGEQEPAWAEDVQNSTEEKVSCMLSKLKGQM